MQTWIKVTFIQYISRAEENITSMCTKYIYHILSHCSEEKNNNIITNKHPINLLIYLINISIEEIRLVILILYCFYSQQLEKKDFYSCWH